MIDASRMPQLSRLLAALVMVLWMAVLLFVQALVIMGPTMLKLEGATHLPLIDLSHVIRDQFGKPLSPPRQ